MNSNIAYVEFLKWGTEFWSPQREFTAHTMQMATRKAVLSFPLLLFPSSPNIKCKLSMLTIGYLQLSGREGHML